MLDIIIVGIIVVLSLLYFIVKIIRFIRKPSGSSGCGCSSSDCTNCPMVSGNNSSSCR